MAATTALATMGASRQAAGQDPSPAVSRMVGSVIAVIVSAVAPMNTLTRCRMCCRWAPPIRLRSPPGPGAGVASPSGFLRITQDLSEGI